MSIKDKVDSVVSRDSFVKFIDILRHDLIMHPEEWENLSLDSFLEAISAWVKDMDGYCKNNNIPMPIAPSWKNVAEMMLAAKYYE